MHKTKTLVRLMISVSALSCLAHFLLELGTCHLIFYGYAVVFVANITTAVYLATITRTGTSCYSPSYRFESYLSQCLMSDSPGKSSGLNSFGLMWCNGNLSR